MRILGIDYGEKRIGIAITDPEGVFALPHGVLENTRESISKIVLLCKEKEVAEIVLGKSVDFKGEPNPVQKKIEKFKEDLLKSITLPVFYENETLTTKEARHIQGKHKNIDSSAAALILDSYLMRKQHNTRA